MTAHTNQSRSGGDYEWRYEYYDDEEPVSFESLKANRYSIVIGFWVGLAVFVIFMFFVLTLLTKTGASHLEISDPSEKHHGDDVQIEAECPQAFPLHPLFDETRSLFHFYINEEGQTNINRDAVIGRGRRCGRDPVGLCLQSTIEDERRNQDDNFLSNFNIPNFVQSEHSSSIDNDDLLLCGLPTITDSESPVLNS
ncbi:melanocortin-2 receptor accessory protein 2B [Paramisgurnus dabryanus]|uniref:melanocortin-2 receptor accessory protein 2B n=1 Tax=Paramisgurnus dabryanus TaxID=90735 RepID=UPI0031F40A08